MLTEAICRLTISARRGAARGDVCLKAGGGGGGGARWNSYQYARGEQPRRWGRGGGLWERVCCVSGGGAGGRGVKEARSKGERASGRAWCV